MFANDAQLLDKTLQEQTLMIRKLSEQNAKAGLFINTQKTKALAKNIPNKFAIMQEKP